MEVKGQQGLGLGFAGAAGFGGPGAHGWIGGDRRGAHREMGPWEWPGAGRMAFYGRQRDGLEEGRRVKCHGRGRAGGFCASRPAGDVVFAGCQERWVA